MCQAMQEIMEDCRAESWRDGEAAGLINGKKQANYETSINLLLMGLPKDRIAEALNTPLDVVEAWLK